jgi:hypothetical protein
MRSAEISPPVLEGLCIEQTTLTGHVLVIGVPTSLQSLVALIAPFRWVVSGGVKP